VGLPIGEASSISQFYGAVRGARLEVRTPAGAVAGRLLSVEKRRRARGSDSVDEVDQLAIVGDGGEVRLVELSPLVTVRFADRELQQQLGRYLTIVGSTLRQSVRRMTLTTAGTGERPLFVSYVSEVPVWKTTYRLVIPSKPGAKPFLQGWAIVDNTVGEDWMGVEMSLVAGAPQSFIQEIAQPYYLRRPVVPLPSAYQLKPQTHQAALTGGGAAGMLTGKVTDKSGGILPGVTVRATGADGTSAGEAVTDSNGKYVLNLPAGTYTLKYTLSGFKPGTAEDIEVEAGAIAEEDQSLEVGALMETVMVTGSRLARESAQAPRVEFDVAGSLATLEAAASGREMGDLFEYRIKEPVTIRKNQSAMVPMLTNSTGLTLDGGSFTVLESDAFAGEGLIEPLKPGEKRLLSYAADTAVRVNARTDPSPSRVERMRIERGTIVQTIRDEARSVYTVRNEDAAARTVVVEHPAREGWALSPGTPQPAESTGALHRFRLTVEPKTTVTLTVDESRPRLQNIVISRATSDDLTLVLQRSGSGASLESALKPVLDKKQAIAAIDQELAARQAESGRIAADQGRVRENMKALKGGAEEKALLQRYVRQLDEQETRLEALGRETADLQQKRSAAQAELDKLIEGLTVEEVRK
jgi:hypothetical protein